MNLDQARQVMLRTHIAALNLGVRANAIELKSGPGIGKSSTVDDVCLDLARMLDEPVGLTVQMLATIASVDVRGFMLPTKKADGTLGSQFSEPPWQPVKSNILVFTPDGRKYRTGEWDGAVPRVGICFLDEFGQGEDEVKKAAAELLLHGQVGSARLPDGWRVIAASNRMTDRSGVLRALAFITNRRMEISIEAHLGTWTNWVSNLSAENRPHHLTVSFAVRQPDLVFREAVPPGDSPFCTPRTLILMDRDLRALRTSEEVAQDRLPLDSVAREVCAGWIGGGESAQFFTHVKFADLLPDVADIEHDPMTAKLPTHRDAQMVCAFMLAHNVTARNGGKMVRYMGRLHVDMQVLAAKTILKMQDRSQHLANTQEFSDWLKKHKDVLIAANA